MGFFRFWFMVVVVTLTIFVAGTALMNDWVKIAAVPAAIAIVVLRNFIASWFGRRRTRT